MNLSIGIVGLPNAGKSTLFNALLGRQIADVAEYPFTTIEPNVGVVEVPDERLERLAGIISGSPRPAPASTRDDAPADSEGNSPSSLSAPADTNSFDLPKHSKSLSPLFSFRAPARPFQRDRDRQSHADHRTDQPLQPLRGRPQAPPRRVAAPGPPGVWRRFVGVRP